MASSLVWKFLGLGIFKQRWGQKLWSRFLVVPWLFTDCELFFLILHIKNYPQKPFHIVPFRSYAPFPYFHVLHPTWGPTSPRTKRFVYSLIRLHPFLGYPLLTDDIWRWTVTNSVHSSWIFWNMLSSSHFLDLKISSAQISQKKVQFYYIFSSHLLTSVRSSNDTSTHTIEWVDSFLSSCFSSEMSYPPHDFTHFFQRELEVLIIAYVQKTPQNAFAKTK